MPQQQIHAEDDYMIATQAEEIHYLIRDQERLSWIVVCVRICLLVFAALGAFKLGMLYSEYYYGPAPQPYIHSNNEENSVLPRQTSTLTDWGHSTRFHGWVDVQNQGVSNDYARYVGPTDEYSFVWLSIAVAGSTEQHTKPGLYEEHSGIEKRTLAKPRQIIPNIDELGLPYYFRGWVDVQNQGVANDYAYYVAATDDIPFPWLTIALAGSSQQRTCVGLYMEKYGIVRPTLGKRHYKQTTDISCQYWASIIRQFFPTSTHYGSYQLDSFLDYSQLVVQQVIVENLSGKNTSNATSITLWRQLLPNDVLTVITATQNTSAFKALDTSLLAVMIVHVVFHYVF